MGAWEDGFAYGWAEAMKAMGGSAFYHPSHPSSEPSRLRVTGMPSRARSAPKRTRAPSAYNKRLGRALKRLNKRARKKDGSYRKAWNAKKVMRLAHKEAKK